MSAENQWNRSFRRFEDLVQRGTVRYSTVQWIEKIGILRDLSLLVAQAALSQTDTKSQLRPLGATVDRDRGHLVTRAVAQRAPSIVDCTEKATEILHSLA